MARGPPATTHVGAARRRAAAATIAYDAPPAERGRQSAGTVHHVAWGTTVAEHPRWHELLARPASPNSGIIDRHYFHSIYFREPSGVLFEIADDGPGFTVDVPLEQLGSAVILPPQLEPQRSEIEARADAAARPARWLGQDSLAWIHRRSVDASAPWAEPESIGRGSSWRVTWIAVDRLWRTATVATRRGGRWIRA